MLNLILMPAYGRRYRNNSDALADWNSGKDFRIVGGGPYCSIRDLDSLKRLHNNVLLHTDQGGVFVVQSVPACNYIDKLL